MFRKALTIGGSLLLSGAMVLVTPGDSQARPRGGGGGHGGGGGAHFGGGGFGGYHGNVGGYHGGGYYGGYRGGYYHGGGYYGGYHPYGRYGYYGYGYSPYFYDYGYPYYSYPDTGAAMTYDPTYSTDSTAPAAPPVTSQSLYLSPTAPADPLAHVTVSVPADARLWFQNTLTTPTGSIRQFNSPPLTPGRSYTYDVRATWTENGREVTQTQKIGVTAGADVNVTFPTPPATAGPAPAAPNS